MKKVILISLLLVSLFLLGCSQGVIPEEVEELPAEKLTELTEETTPPEEGAIVGKSIQLKKVGAVKKNLQKKVGMNKIDIVERNENIFPLPDMYEGEECSICISGVCITSEGDLYIDQSGTCN